MAVVSVIEQPQGEGSQDRLYQRRYTRNFKVLCNDVRDGPVVIRSATTGSPPVLRIPGIGNSYYVSATEVDRWSFVENVVCTRAEKTSAGCYWIARVEYGPYDASTYPADPIEWPIDLQWDRVEYDEICVVDINGNPVANSAGQPFDPPITRQMSKGILRITRNEADYDPKLADLYSDCINSDTFMGRDPYTVKVSGIPGVIKTNPQGGYYAAVTYTFEFDKKKWKKFPLDIGLQELDGSTPPKLRKLLDDQGQPISDPAKLDGSGHQLPSNGTPVFLEFDVYDEVNFGTAFHFDFSNVPGLGPF
jgi:hypothetical protein